MRFSHSHGGISAGKCAANEASDGGSAKKSEAFTRKVSGLRPAIATRESPCRDRPKPPRATPSCPVKRWEFGSPPPALSSTSLLLESRMQTTGERRTESLVHALALAATNDPLNRAEMKPLPARFVILA